jgi:hypothetical protein
MNSTEEALTSALDAAAQAVRPGTLAPLPEPGGSTRPRRRTRASWLVPVLAAVAVVSTIVGALIAPRLVAGTGVTTGGGNTPLPAGPGGPPAFYAAVMDTACPANSTCVTIRATATGALVATVPSPVDGDGKKLFAIGVTTYDDRTFYALYSEDNPGNPRATPKGNGELLIYRFTLSARGALTGPALVGGGAIPGQRHLFLDGDAAVSPDGTRLAVAASTGSAFPQEIVVISLRTGRQAIWRGGLERAATSMSIADVSWTGDSKSVVYLAQWCPASKSQSTISGPIACQLPGSGAAQVRKLAITGTGGRLAGSTVLLAKNAAYSEIGQALISPDGKELTALVRQGDKVKVVTIDVATGTERRLLYSAPIGAGPSVEGYGALLRTDSSGRYILFAGWYFLSGPPVTHGWLSGGKTHTLVPSQLLGVPIAW